MKFSGVKLKHIRKSNGFTLQQLAERIDSSKSYIWELENNTYPNPGFTTVAKLAKELNISMDYFVTED